MNTGPGAYRDHDDRDEARRSYTLPAMPGLFDGGPGAGPADGTLSGEGPQPSPDSFGGAAAGFDAPGGIGAPPAGVTGDPGASATAVTLHHDGTVTTHRPDDPAPAGGAHSHRDDGSQGPDRHGHDADGAESSDPKTGGTSHGADSDGGGHHGRSGSQGDDDDKAGNKSGDKSGGGDDKSGGKSGGPDGSGKDGGSSGSGSGDPASGGQNGSGDTPAPLPTSTAARLTLADMEKILDALAAATPKVKAQAQAWQAAGNELHALVSGGQDTLSGHVGKVAANWSGVAADAFTYKAGSIVGFADDVAAAFGGGGGAPAARPGPGHMVPLATAQPTAAAGPGAGVAEALTTASDAMAKALTAYQALLADWGSPAKPPGALVTAVANAVNTLMANPPNAMHSQKFGRLTYSVTGSGGNPGHSQGQQISFSLYADPPTANEKQPYVFNGTLLYQITGSAAAQQHSVSVQLSDGKGRMTATNAQVHPADVQKYFVEAYMQNLIAPIAALQTAYETAKQQLPRAAATAPTGPTRPTTTPSRPGGLIPPTGTWRPGMNVPLSAPATA